MENHFFELPVYRCSEVIYSKELDKLQKRIDLQVPYLKGQEKETEVIKTDLFYRFSHGYAYNEVIGWIQLYVLGNQIRGKYFFEVNPYDKRKIKKRFDKCIRKKQFELIGKAFECSIYDDISDKIYLKIINQINNLTKEKPFVGKIIDTSKLEKISMFVDWKKLLKGLSKFSPDSTDL
ncbi:hypothetical protein [Flavobacterium nitratireducens]|uniref:hypothetical protein n=1 Tax=Flavobacterium nitratireducens TaxID=992289 RepID=UPI002415665A|nr:hypothetical protein [Flavobacterium nitratireducens]